jgi:hypothetical protein
VPNMPLQATAMTWRFARSDLLLAALPVRAAPERKRSADGARCATNGVGGSCDAREKV